MLKAHILSPDHLEHLVSEKEKICFERRVLDPSGHFISLPVAELTVHEADYLAEHLNCTAKSITVGWGAADLYFRRVVSNYPELLEKAIGNDRLDKILLIWDVPDAV